MKAIKWISLIFVILLIGACTVNHHLASEGTSKAPTKSLYKNGKFYNAEKMAPNSARKMAEIFLRYFTEKKQHAFPSQALPLQTVTRVQLDALSNDAIHTIKLGHSSILLKVHGEFWLLDPVFAQRASPFSFMGPKRFQPTPISLEELPPIDKVLISHNHYDHLDKQSVKLLARKTKQFLVPLGVAGDLARWGINPTKVKEFDWWQELKTKQGFIAFTPIKHFSGRALNDGNKTLWGSWVISANNQTLYFSGDSGYFDGFKQIGERYGPFDMTFIETGAYDKDWPDVHMTPEQSVQAHLDLKGKLMTPIHNGTFDLAFHAWFEPLERVKEEADKQWVQLNTPTVGEILTLGHEYQTSLWWRDYMPSESLAMVTAN
ncbi:MBL fold metallo-hydrolase [Pseudoalteromonas sp. SSM20]|uniref:MBL fold metallo-hydrolase n=1 Tax=Pseudoalteromonas sp. SSM20 TaxID=3139394 RepID=UPI003BAC4F11